MQKLQFFEFDFNRLVDDLTGLKSRQFDLSLDMHSKNI